ncbi:aminotransferase class V-fold PLP-dependent enzyme [Raineyella fluvialis]|uniref:aminotransferase class V-fold PLP-dependent enzyme n=1 Tax=Raineyella fluvialis TaxID=2662261 RepID=UPI0030CF3BDF
MVALRRCPGFRSRAVRLRRQRARPRLTLGPQGGRPGGHRGAPGAARSLAGSDRLRGGQERGVRSGTLAPLLAVGFAAAATEAAADLVVRMSRWEALRSRLLAGLAGLPGVRPHLPAEASPAILNVAFDGCEADDLLLLLDAAGIDASVGSACTAGVSSTSHVLLAMGLPENEARSSLRFSFGASTGEAEVDRLLAALPDALVRARRARGAGSYDRRARRGDGTEGDRR